MSITRLKADGTKFTLYAVCNSRGDVEELRKEDGTLYARYVYDSWGNVLHIYSGTGTTEITDTANLAKQNPFRYRGYYYDAETKLYYLQSRYYDPEVGRFLNADDVDFIGYSGENLSYNAFAYCESNPMNNSDEKGNASTKSNGQKREYHIYVYLYEFKSSRLSKHLDISLDGTIYSYGTNEPGVCGILKKAFTNVKGCLKVSNKKAWNSSGVGNIEGVADIRLTEKEKCLVERYLKKFINNSKLKKRAKGINQYTVTSGKYKYYSFTKANCATFVRDILLSCTQNLINRSIILLKGKKYDPNKFNTPQEVYKIAKKMESIR